MKPLNIPAFIACELNALRGKSGALFERGSSSRGIHGIRCTLWPQASCGRTLGSSGLV